jgi:hypothetical protein
MDGRNEKVARFLRKLSQPASCTSVRINSVANPARKSSIIGYNTIDSANQLESIQYFVVCYITCNARDTAFSPHYLLETGDCTKKGGATGMILLFFSFSRSSTTIQLISNLHHGRVGQMR